MVALLLRRGASIIAVNNAGENALFLAASNDFRDLCTILINKGQDPAVLSSSGKSALNSYGSSFDRNDPESEYVKRKILRCRLTPAEKAEGAAALAAARASYVRREENWCRRFPFLRELIRAGLLLTAAQRQEQADVQAASDKSAAIAPIPRETKQQNREFLLREVLASDSFVRRIASFI